MSSLVAGTAVDWSTVRLHRRRSTSLLETDTASEAFARLHGDAIQARISHGLYLARNPCLPYATLLRVGGTAELEREARLLKRLNNAGWAAAPAYLGHWQHDTLACLRIEYIEGTSLLDLFCAGDSQPLEPRRLLELTAHFAKLLRTLHAHGVGHLNITPSHAIVTDAGTLRLIDWRHARFLSAGEPIGCCRAARYRAPEAKSSLAVARPSLDVWSFGATLFCLITAGAPISDMDRLLPVPHLPAWFSYMIRAACNVDAAARPTMAQICDEYFSIRAVPWSESLVMHIFSGVGKQIADSFRIAEAAELSSSSSSSPRQEEQPRGRSQSASRSKTRMVAARSPALKASAIAPTTPNVIRLSARPSASDSLVIAFRGDNH